MDDIIITDKLLKVDVNLSTSREIRLILSPEFTLKWYKNLAEFIKFVISTWIFLVSNVVIITLITSTIKTRIPLSKNNVQRISNKIDNLGSYPKYLIKLFINWENLSVPIESDIDKFITGIIIPNPTSSIIELIKERVIRSNKPNLDLKKQTLKISYKFLIINKIKLN